MPAHERKSIQKKSWILYVSYEKDGKEVLTDYQLSAISKADAKNNAMGRMAAAGGKNRHIDEIHLIDEKFKQHEAEMVEH